MIHTKTKNIFFLLHLSIGFLLAKTTFFGTILSNSIFIISLLHVIFSKNRQNQALSWAAYLTSFEVLFRMSKSLFFYEFIKYWVIILLLTGIIIEYKKRFIHPFYIFYLFALIFSITYTQIPMDYNFRKKILFNLSGPFVLGISALYNYNRQLPLKKIVHILYISGLPIISTLVYLYIKTPDLNNINFTSSANFATSGGFGPNQVSTILGFGIFIFAVLLLVKYRFTGYKILDISLLIYITYRGILTFSRGGIWTALIALIIFVFYYLKSEKTLLKTGLKYGVLSLITGLLIWQYTVNVTGGMIENRYLGKNTKGVEKEDITSGRIDIFETELEMFYKNPILGVGAGAVKYVREKMHPGMIAASHNEISRLIAEQGMFGILSIIGLMIIPIIRILKIDNLNKAFLSAFFLFWFLTINHSAMRIAFPGFIYGLSLIIIYHEKNSLHRK